MSMVLPSLGSGSLKPLNEGMHYGLRTSDLYVNCHKSIFSESPSFLFTPSAAEGS